MVNERDSKKEWYYIGYVKNGKARSKWLSLMTEREAQEYTVSLYTRIARKIHNACYWGLLDDDKQVYADCNWSIIKKGGNKNE